MRKDVLIAGDDGEATRVGRALIDAGYRAGGREGASRSVIPGTVEQLAAYGDLGFGDVMIGTMATVPQPQAVRSIELAGGVARLVEEA